MVRVRIVLGDMKYLMGPVKQVAEALGICTEENWGVKIVSSLYTMLSERFNLKTHKRFDSLIWSLVVGYFYTRRDYIIG